LTTADLDANLYFALRQRWLLAFVSAWLLQCVLFFLFHRTFIIEALPFLYLLLRWSRVTSQQNGYPKVTELMAASFALYLVSLGINLLEQAGSVRPHWPYALVGCFNVLGAVGMLVAYARCGV
jgi:hypothetical protein